MKRYQDRHVVVFLSDEAITRACKEGLLRTKRARLHEIAACVACHAVVVILVAWFVDGLARGVM